MEKIRFIKDKDKTYIGNINIRGNVISILFNDEIPEQDVLLGGFELLNEHNDRVQGEYLDYNTLYREYENNTKLFELSNDGSVYVPYVPTVRFSAGFGGSIDGDSVKTVNSYEELVIPTPVADENYKFVKWNPEIPEFGDVNKDISFRALFEYVPTEEEIKAVFEQKKLDKIIESKSLLDDYLETHPLKSTCHNNIEGTYKVTTEKQTLMSNNYLTYTIKKQVDPDNAELTWNETGKECEVWTEEEFLQLIMEVEAYVKPRVSLQQKYEVMINASETEEELDAIILTYEMTE